jgi:hypothetical protein
MAAASRQPKNGEPIEPFGNGRATNGRFAPGWKGGPGNPYAKKAAEVRAAFIKAATPAEIMSIVKAILKKAKKGDLAAANIIFDRLLGRPATGDQLERLEALEASVFRKRVDT